MKEPLPCEAPEDWDREFNRHFKLMGPWYYFTIPFLCPLINGNTKLIELGCGQGHILRYLSENGFLRGNQIWAMDQSQAAADYIRRRIPEAHVTVADISQVASLSNQFDICLLMETVEHLEDPHSILRHIYASMTSGGWLFLSFPNFLHIPWLVVRVLSDLLKKPNWIVRQPVDKIYTVPHVKRLVTKAGFEFRGGIGSNYGPPILHRLESAWMTKTLNKVGLWWVSFHPILVFRKPISQTSAARTI